MRRSLAAARAPGWALALICSVLAGGCSFGGGRTAILDPIDAPMKVGSMRIVEGQHTADLTPEERDTFRQKLTEQVHAEGRFADGGAMTLEYRIVLHDPGDQLARYVVGFGVGQGEVVVEATFRDERGAEVARIECTGRLTMGTFGGDFRAAYDEAVDEVVEYADRNFLLPRETPATTGTRHASTMYDG